MTGTGEILFLVSAVVLLWVAYIRIQKCLPSAMVFASLAVYASFAGFDVDPLLRQFGATQYLNAALVFLVGACVLILSVGLAGKLAGDDMEVPTAWTNQEHLRHAKYGAFLLVGSAVLFFVDRSDVLEIWNVARGDSGPLSVVATFFLLLGCPGCVSAFGARKWLLGIAMLVTCVAVFLLSGSRAAIFGALLLWLWMLLMRTRGQSRQIVVLAVSVTLAFSVHILLRHLRGLGILGVMASFQAGDLLSNLMSSNAGEDFSGGEGAIAKYFVFSTTVSSTQDFGVLTSLFRLLTLAIPRINDLIPKPQDVTYLLWTKAYVAGLFNDAAGQEILLESFLTRSPGSLHPTMFGEYFLAGGWLAMVLTVAVVGQVLVAIDRFILGRHRFAALMMMGPVLVGNLFVGRGNSDIGLGYFF